MNFTAIDFETANYDRSSACSIGLVEGAEGQVVDTMYSLIRPPTGYFLPMFVDIHGIDTEVVRDAPSFADLWPRVAAFIGKDRLVAHNYGFDKRVLEGTLDYYGIEAPGTTGPALLSFRVKPGRGSAGTAWTWSPLRWGFPSTIMTRWTTPSLRVDLRRREDPGVEEALTRRML